jgi:hypothetical protein
VGGGAKIFPQPVIVFKNRFSSFLSVASSERFLTYSGKYPVK